MPKSEHARNFARDPVAMAQQLVRTPSVNPSLEDGGPGEGAISELVAEWLVGWGYRPDVVEVAPRRYNVVASRGEGAGPSLLSLDLDRGVVRALDPLRRLKFERYHLTLQALVDQGAKVVDAERPQPVALRRDTELGQGALS